MIRRERPHPGAQLRFTDLDGHWFTAFITDTDQLSWKSTTAPTPGSRTVSAASATP